MDKTQFLVIDGGTVKTGAEGMVEGLGIVFGSEDQPDRSQERDFFTAESKISRKTSFEVPLYWEHGIKGYEDSIGEAILTKAVNGWHASAEIDLSTEAGQKFFDVVKSQQYGFSTGSMTHLVRRESKGNNTHFLKKWPVGEISLVKMPAEARALVQSVKSLSDLEVEGDAFVGVPQANPEETKDSTTIAIFDVNGVEIWNLESGFPIPPEAKSVEIKYAAGSVTYSLWTGDDDSSIDININDYSDPSDVLSGIQAVLARAASAVAKDQAVDDLLEAQDLQEDQSDMDMMKTEKEFNDRVAAIVKSMLPGTDERIGELEAQLADKENDVADLKSQIDSRDEALTIAQERMAQLEILAGAAETINKYKGN